MLALPVISGLINGLDASFGLAAAAGAWDSHWVYWVGPIAGALLAAAAYELMREPHYREPPAPADPPPEASR